MSIWVEKKPGELFDGVRTGNGSPQGADADPAAQAPYPASDASGFAPPAGSGSVPSVDLPPPPAQLVAALTAFEQAAPENFRRSISDAEPVDDEGRPARPGSNWPKPGSGKVAKLKMAGVALGALVLVVVTWALCSAKAATPKPSSSTAASSASPPSTLLRSDDKNAAMNNNAPDPAMAAEPAPTTEAPAPAKSAQSPARSHTRATKKPCGKSGKPCP